MPMSMAFRFPSGSVRILYPKDEAAAIAFVRLLYGPCRTVRITGYGGKLGTIHGLRIGDPLKERPYAVAFG